MGDDDKTPGVETQEGGGATTVPAHEPADTTAPSPPEGNAMKEMTTDDPAEPAPAAKAADDSDKKSSAEDTAATAAADDDQEGPKPSVGAENSKPVAIVASSKKARPPYKYDPDKITLRFLFANRDGLTVTVECKPGDTVGEVKGALISVWPDGLPDCQGGETVRLVCMGKGFLMPDTRTLEDCQIPVFKTHPTPINVSIKPSANSGKDSKTEKSDKTSGASSSDPAASGGANPGTQQASQGCACIIL